jgi:hypothetical protein
MKTFQARLDTDAPGSLFFEVPFDVKAEFGKARAPVVVHVNGHVFRSTVAVYGGRFYIPVRKSNRDAARVGSGDMVRVKLELDTEKREVAPPPELARALQKSARARAAWDALSYSHKKEHADAISEAKRPETRTRRVERAVAMLVAPKR